MFVYPFSLCVVGLSSVTSLEDSLKERPVAENVGIVDCRGVEFDESNGKSTKKCLDELRCIFEHHAKEQHVLVPLLVFGKDDYVTRAWVGRANFIIEVVRGFREGRKLQLKKRICGIHEKAFIIFTHADNLAPATIVHVDEFQQRLREHAKLGEIATACRQWDPQPPEFVAWIARLRKISTFFVVGDNGDARNGGEDHILHNVMCCQAWLALREVMRMLDLQ